MRRAPFSPSRSGGSPGSPSESGIAVSWSRDGVEYRPDPVREDWLCDAGRFGADAELVRLLGQLEDEGFAQQDAARLKLGWPDFYRLATSPEYEGAVAAMKLPSMQVWRPVLSSKGTLTDKGFAVSIAGWIAPDGQRPQGNATIEGAVIQLGQRVALLPEGAWRVVESVARFWARPASARDADSNRRAWSDIRSQAVSAGADMADFLRNTIVLTPEKLRIGLRKGDVGSASMVEVLPEFDGAPARWLETFDSRQEVPERYDITDGKGIVQVMLAPPVRAVLREIRRMGRRIAGERAKSFLRNPFAVLGPDAALVIDPQQFEQARDDAGVSFARFTARVLRDARGYPSDCALLVEETVHGAAVHSTQLRFAEAQDLEGFVTLLDARIAASAPCCHWQGYDLEILGDTPDQAKLLRAALHDMSASSRPRAAEIFDLSQYSDRIGVIGVEKPYYSPFITRKSDDEGWVPENVDIGIFYTPEEGGETIAVVLGEKSLAVFRAVVEDARINQRETFTFPSCPQPLPLPWAIDALETLDKTIEHVGRGKFSPPKPGPRDERKGLVIKPNVDQLDYEERRGALTPTSAPPRLPTALRPDVALKEHQLSGVAWLQHLWRLSPEACRGALLADDMGLGKTIQLLAFIAAAIEEQADIDPFLIVAPVSLLDNWKEEIAKFLVPGAMRVLTLYGKSLAEKRVPRHELEEELVQGGVTRLLKPGWLGGAQVVLTTYETLRDLEFSLAAQPWSAMICDEAQKIKNPNALVSRAAKKQNARFKIACTGTPVENTLTDIWSLFDFVQPGLLGALKEFGERYRRPIEAESDEEKQRVEELRALIEPQTLRRTKAEVAKDLPKKIEVVTCRTLPLSNCQRAHYANAVAQFRQRESGEFTGLQSPLGLLLYLRRLCSDPQRPGQSTTGSEPLAEIERDSPKMKWLLAELRAIETRGEKVIVFCEFKDLQRTLKRAIGERFGVEPDVINGDTSADSAHAGNRQRRIRKFQDQPGFGVIVLSPLAVGFGVNIQAANHVVHFTRTWNPAKEDQATDRAYRIGQTRDVHVYYPIVVAQDFLTFDAKLDQLLDWKRGLATDMLNGAGDMGPADFSDLQAPDGGEAFGNEPISADDIGRLDADAFEAFCALLWSKRGYPQVIRTPRAGDGGVDVLAIRGAEGVAIQCKSSGIEGRALGWEAVRDVVAGVHAYAQRHPGVQFTPVAVTNQRFNDTAKHQARVSNVALVEGDELVRLIAQYPMKRGELQRFLGSAWG
ncbi:helicase SNF2 [Verminephrobacter aporrectodeae subsp. tuberculatae]|uniref:SNF2-related protein n=1 Tax=Verminephrobacter aporrectodeae TaxID=1110389 RepID=UPI002244F24A|nr:SNF2-related protein [Verminephrobacter aporrectodeae]MCW8198839.1 helicase SNF2 [Verminephrobacter aporrectodeae subsp. tuberculatae]